MDIQSTNYLANVENARQTKEATDESAAHYYNADMVQDN